MALNPRVAVSALVLSASTLVGIAVHEAYRPVAYLPTPQDKPTIGFGETNGVKLGDKTTPDRALVQLLKSADKVQSQMRECIGDVPMYQYEWDSVISWAYNVGTGAACSSTLVKKLRAGDYAGMCAELLRWNRQAGKVLNGLTKRRQDEYRHCIGNDE